MKKLRRFLGRIPAETCLKKDYFGSKSQKSPSAGGSAPRPPLAPRGGVPVLVK